MKVLVNRESDKSETPNSDSGRTRRGDIVRPIHWPPKMRPKHDALHLCGITSDTADFSS